MNYAIPTYRYDPSLFRGALYGTGGQGGLSIEARQSLSNIDPAAGYDFYLRHQPRLSSAHDTALRRLFDTFRTRYAADVASDPVANSGKQWTDWLGEQDINYELARMPAQFRAEQPTRFSRPARFVSF